jgi:hypothetical protein
MKHGIYLHPDSRDTYINNLDCSGYTTDLLYIGPGATYSSFGVRQFRTTGARLLLTGTSQAVAHGLAITPTNQSINVVKEGAGTDWWFSAAPTSTNFYINGTAGKYVDWSIN